MYSPGFTVISSPASLLSEAFLTPNSTTSWKSLITEPITSTTIFGTPQAACCASGTLIRAIRGEVAVEDLQIGDMVVTASGTARPIVWLGHRSVDCSSLADDLRGSFACPHPRPRFRRRGVRTPPNILVSPAIPFA